MLATCVANGWPIASYLAPDHPLQQAIAARIGSLGGAAVSGAEVDGCGAPAYAVDLVSLARGFAALATARSGAPQLVADAMRAHPRLVGGTGRPVTELAADVAGLLAKEGAEGVWAAALPDGRAFAAKIDDGSARGLGPLLAAVLTRWGVGGAAVARWSAAPVLGGGRPVGSIRWAPELRALLGL